MTRDLRCTSGSHYPANCVQGLHVAMLRQPTLGETPSLRGPMLGNHSSSEKEEGLE